MPLEYIDPLFVVKNVKRTAQWYQDAPGFQPEMFMPDGKGPTKAVLNAVGTRAAPKVVSR